MVVWAVWIWACLPPCGAVVVIFFLMYSDEGVRDECFDFWGVVFAGFFDESIDDFFAVHEFHGSECGALFE